MDVPDGGRCLRRHERCRSFRLAFVAARDIEMEVPSYSVDHPPLYHSPSAIAPRNAKWAYA